MAVKIVRDQSGALQSVTFRRHSNFHAHFRQPPILRPVALATLKHVAYALAMPNNGIAPEPVIADYGDAMAYHELIMGIARGAGYTHLKDVIATVYFSGRLTTTTIERLGESDTVRAVKYYPPHPGATTGSGHGVPLWEKKNELRAMEENGVRLLLHGENTHDEHGREIPHPKREAHFYLNTFPRLREEYPNLLICAEHISTVEAIDAVTKDMSGKTVATVTPQHSLLASPDFSRYSSWKNHLKCMPILKTPEDRAAILEFITSGDPRVIAGDDTAPHLSQKKQGSFDECMSGCWLPHSAPLYALAFESVGALDWRFERFMSLNGPKWWDLPPPLPEDTVTIRAAEDGIPDPTEVPQANDIVVPMGWSKEADRFKLQLAI